MAYHTPESFLKPPIMHKALIVLIATLGCFYISHPNCCTAQWMQQGNNSYFANMYWSDKGIVSILPSQPPNVYVTNDQGESWHNAFYSSYGIQSATEVNGTIIMVGHGFVARSRDHGLVWRIDSAGSRIINGAARLGNDLIALTDSA